MCPQETSEEERRIIARAKKGDREALGELYERYVDAVYHYMIYRTSDHNLAEDLTAVVFASVITSIERYEDRGIPFGAWLFRIARARLVDYWRKSKPRREQRVTFTADMEEFLVGESPENQLENEALLESLQYLTESEREVVLLRFVVGLDNGEVAEVVGSNSNAVKAMIYRALKKLRKIMKRRRTFQVGD
jgi:RNA polymerase sigma-70 factor (ECF subfamily)